MLTGGEIDNRQLMIIARHYGFTDEELDFIPSASLRTGINYDIKYRMGKALFGEDETETEDE